ncbi:hypothetical protein ACFYOP_24880 [Streptomyces sp. NPDC006294]|uniref:hypothetical protein n=1 Tax=Streptomyces sp. NPDC006294 TaxID=3364743 RepID=UPI003696BDA8
MRATPLLTGLDARLPALRELYQDLHAHPEPAFQEVRTAGVVAQLLRDQGWEVTERVGGTGVVGVLRSAAGPVVPLRADMDGLPVLEATGLPYASRWTGVDADGAEVPVMHACGHDMHVTLPDHRTRRAGAAGRGGTVARGRGRGIAPVPGPPGHRLLAGP